MMGDRQSQKSGDSSTNYQAQRDIVVYGPSVTEVREIAMDVFKANFYELSEKAYKDVFVRAGAFADAFLTKAMEDGQEKIPEAENPDFQYALFSAQREYARVGDEDLGELLVQLLVDRSKIEDRTLIQIVLNQSLAVAPMLTPEQLDALTLIFLINHTINNLSLIHI